MPELLLAVAWQAVTVTVLPAEPAELPTPTCHMHASNCSNGCCSVTAAMLPSSFCGPVQLLVLPGAITILQGLTAGCSLLAQQQGRQAAEAIWCLSRVCSIPKPRVTGCTCS